MKKPRIKKNIKISWEIVCLKPLTYETQVTKGTLYLVKEPEGLALTFVPKQ